MEDPTTLKKSFVPTRLLKDLLIHSRTNNGLSVIEGGSGLYFAFPCGVRNSSINGRLSADADLQLHRVQTPVDDHHARYSQQRL